MKKSHADSGITAASTPGKGSPIPDAPPEAREARKLQGKVLRKTCPRSSHASVILGKPRRDPLALIEASNRGRVENLLPIRFTRMAESSFAFFRGTAILQAYDLKGTPAAGLTVLPFFQNYRGTLSRERAALFGRFHFMVDVALE